MFIILAIKNIKALTLLSVQVKCNFAFCHFICYKKTSLTRFMEGKNANLAVTRCESTIE